MLSHKNRGRGRKGGNEKGGETKVEKTTRGEE